MGEGGIGIIRISGDDAIKIAQKIVSCRNTTATALEHRKSHSMCLADVVDPVDGSRVDEALITVMRAPNTYTKEDVVEINCHGGIMAVRKTLQLALAAGARAADPGEFTKRAFLNGRIDLTQAEAVIDTIQSRTEIALKAAADQLEGGLSNNINEIAERVADVLTQVEAAVDFSDEDIETLPLTELLDLLQKTHIHIDELLATAVRGRMIKEGIRVAIVGRPNVGKSSLLNALLRRERAIVTPIPGTTRDVIEETVTVSGIPLILKDTAGIRESDDHIERIGVELTKKAMQTAELVICVVDGSNDFTEDDDALIGELPCTPSILVVNKSDLPQAQSARARYKDNKINAIVELSAYTGDGINQLESAVEKLLFDGDIAAPGTTIITNARHEQLLDKALHGLDEAIALLRDEQPEEIIAMILRDILRDLGEITGETVTEDILSRIFSQFCIGK
jgi:tRNA modification GTPase